MCPRWKSMTTGWRCSAVGEYWKENWDGWPLHTAAAVAGMVAGFYHPMETLLAVNTWYWPSREATQHDGWRNIWTLHRVLEWGCPVVAGIVMYVVL